MPRDAVLALQLPSADFRSGHIVAATADPEMIRQFCRALIARRQRGLTSIRDASERALVELEVEDLRRRLDFALGNRGEG